MKEPVSIHLDSEHVILRSIGDEEAEPAILSGTVVLDLSERTDIKDIRCVGGGNAVRPAGRTVVIRWWMEMDGTWSTWMMDHLESIILVHFLVHSG